MLFSEKMKRQNLFLHVVHHEKEPTSYVSFGKIHINSCLPKTSLSPFLVFFENPLDLELTLSSTIISVLETLFSCKKQRE